MRNLVLETVTEEVTRKKVIRMARPTKEGLDYFPLDVDMDQDDKVALIEAQHGVTGFAIVVKLLMKIYKNSYYYDWTEKEQLLFSRVINVDINTLNEVVNDCVKWGIFSEKMYDKYKILTSNGIQIRYLEAASRRQKVKISKEHLLISNPKINEYKNLVIDGINVDINSLSEEVNDDTNMSNHNINDNIGTQSKVKESKVKKSKENIDSEIKNFRLRYSEKQLKVIDDYLEMIRHTRVSAKISGSVIHGMYKSWDKHPCICVEYGLTAHLNNPAHHSKKENYTLGIIRNTTADEASQKLNGGFASSKKGNPNGIDFNKFV